MQQYHLNYYYNNKLLLQEQKEQLSILTAQYIKNIYIKKTKNISIDKMLLKNY